MSDREVRPLVPEEFRAARSLFNAAVHWPDPSEEQWARIRPQFERGRVLGAFEGGATGAELAGTARSLTSSLTVPGGAVLPAAAVSGVAVRADCTRRGVLTALMHEQLDAVLRAGEPVAVLHASESLIYGRFGYGPATRTRTVSMRSGQARVRAEAPAGGRVRLVGEQAQALLPELYRSIGQHRHGMIARPDEWWGPRLHRDGRVVVAVHSDERGEDDGFVVYSPKTRDHRFDDGGCTLRVSDLQAATTTAAVQLWRFLLDVDMVTEVVAADRPVDEPLEWWLTDRRGSQVTSVQDELWVRLVNVEESLHARGYGDAPPVVLDVRDEFLPENAGLYRIGPEGVARTKQPAQLSLDVATLASLYLGDVAPSTLADAGLVGVHEQDVLPTADALFATGSPPWCGTIF